MCISNNTENKSTILVVDDELDNCLLLKRSLRRNYNVLTATSPKEGLEILATKKHDIAVIITDQRMPVMTGTEFLEETLKEYPYTVKILLTGYADVDAMIDAINKCELFHYLNKPVDQNELQVVVDKAVESYQLINQKRKLLQELSHLLSTTIQAISGALDAKDQYTHGHSWRVTMYSLLIGRLMGLDKVSLQRLQLAGLLHDIGKIETPESILNKAGGLTRDEFDIIKRHPGKGKEILSGIRQLTDISSWLRSHHEKYDGTGYPLGLKGDEIPLPARILSVADTYDAMTSDRSYRKGLSHDIAVAEIKKCAGTQFDPAVVKQFIENQHLILETKDKCSEQFCFTDIIEFETITFVGV